MDNAAVFIDGYNLYHGICDAGFRPWLWVDLWELGRVLLPKAVHLAEVNYYTAPARDPDSRRRQDAFLQANKELHRDLQIVEGFSQEEDCCRCRECGTISRRVTEKRTDVNIAVDIVTGAMRESPRRFEILLLVTGDADQVAAVKAAQKQGVRVWVRFPPERPSGHLAEAVGGSSFAYNITLAQLKKSQMPDTVRQVGSSRTFCRPEQWGQRPALST